MADIMSIISSNYVTVGQSSNYGSGKYVAVDPELYEGRWTGKYADNKSFSISISDVDGFRAKVRYESGGTLKFQDVMIKDSSFRVGDSKFFLTKVGTALIKTVQTDPASGNTYLDTAYATQG